MDPHHQSTFNMATFNASTFAPATMVMENTMKSSLGGTTLVALAVVLFARTAIQFYGGEKPPFAGFRVPLEPSFLVRLRFSWGALPMINEGYSKVVVLGSPLGDGADCRIVQKLFLQAC